MLNVWKYDLPMEDEAEIEMPKGARVLHVDVQHGEPRIWVLVDPSGKTVKRRFRVAGTGHPIDAPHVSYVPHVGSFLMKNGALVFHVFDLGER